VETHPALAKKWRDYGGELRCNTPAEFTAFIQADRAMWGKVVRAAGYLPAAYEGYDDGLTMALRLAISGPDGIDVWWSDYGPRTPPPGRWRSLRVYSPGRRASPFRETRVTSRKDPL
jgi:hypothetical protein